MIILVDPFSHFFPQISDTLLHGASKQIPGIQCGNKSKAKQGIFSRGKSRYETLKEMNDEHQNTRGLKRRKKVQTN